MSERSILEIMEDVLFLKRRSIFSELHTEDLRAIAAIGQVVRFERNELIVKEGDPGDSMFIIKTGLVRVTKGSGRDQVQLAMLSIADCFGDMVLFEDMLRSASCYSEEPCQLLKFQRDAMVEVILQHPCIAIELFKMMGRRLRDANEKLEEMRKIYETR